MKCKGFLFDLDGTLVDSLAVVERAWKSWGERHGIATDEVLSFIHGKQAITSLRHFMAGATAEEIQREFVALEELEAGDTEGILALPGALQLLATLDELSIPWAIVTSGSVPVASARHAAAGLPAPAVFVTAERVERGKPEPDAYLLGAQLLDLEPEECVVVEDAAAGILSGLAAGCHVIAVNPPADAQRLEDVDMVLGSLEELIIHKNADESINVYRRH
ncbi:sugar phosphatase [Erwinia piriflorinigrans]|uniref:Phosphoglycolate phosphatase n=1 Tax=Erwinia piriflorinigrans CFBP 5888 TaxID=1161919 RepID=V5ZA79_9GAMM|nr:sugar phosphatase [Erwinia piriflorinigrans]CCG87835.1 Phosphoglycolate phosphatase [Erwinia piriflorinigrans CFBP 5888]